MHIRSGYWLATACLLTVVVLAGVRAAQSGDVLSPDVLSPDVSSPGQASLVAAAGSQASQPAIENATAGTAQTPAESDADDHPRPKPVPTPSPKAIDEAVRRGVDFLVQRQNKSGSWGSAHLTKGLNIFAPVPGAHQAFRTATTALCISALLETGGDRPEVVSAIDRAEAWLMQNLPAVRRATPEAIYNSWCHIYSIDALVRMLARRPGDAPREAQIRKLLDQQIDMLRRYECVDGGWCYYDFAAHTQQPSGASISFVTATGLISLHAARQAGCEVPEKMIHRAMDSIERQKKSDFSYCYGEYLKYRPMHPVNRPGGSLGRSQVCNLALRLWGDVSVTDDVLRAWLDRIFARNLWLDIGRKRPVPHEAWFSVAGYFFYYGHYYAGRCMELLPPAQRPPYQDHLAHVLLQLQEKDGSWWDFPLYDYHQAYGTAFALMSLKRCHHAVEAKP